MSTWKQKQTFTTLFISTIFYLIEPFNLGLSVLLLSACSAELVAILFIESADSVDILVSLNLSSYHQIKSILFTDFWNIKTKNLLEDYKL